MRDTANTASAVLSHEPAASENDCTIAVIGAGFSGTMTAIHLRRSLPASARILLIERSGVFARGVAFAQTDAPHLLNVRAANMSAFPDEPKHFEHWLETCPAYLTQDVHCTEAGSFAARRLYGRYLQETLENTLNNCGGTLQLLNEEVTGLQRVGSGWRLNCHGGKSITASGVVLACGNLPPERSCDGVVFHNPWVTEALDGLDNAAPVLIVGTGLSMVDLVLGLRGVGFEGPVVAISRRGLLPQTHKAILQPWPTPTFSEVERASATGLLKAVRKELRLAQDQGLDWRAVIDSLRPITSSLWHGLPPGEQARFLRHARPYWDIHRHRMAPSAAEAVETWRGQGRLRVVKGRISSIAQSSAGQAEVRLTHAGGRHEELRAQRVIYATGLQSVRHRGGLMAELLSSGLAKMDDLKLGLEVDAKLNVLDATGQAVPGLWALGPLVRGVFWECLAVPDIRVQAQLLGTGIAAAQQAK